jgi:membrane protein implicated in regulation of membrane protease activity
VPARGAPTSRVLLRYLRFHLPGLLVVVGALAAAVRWWNLPRDLAAAGVALWLLKDVVLFPLLRSAYEPDGSGAPPRPIGELGVAIDAGWVRVGPELWRARRAGGAPALQPGARVRVVAVDGLELEVEAVSEPPP